ncbi:hypothetical protein SVA_3537 [Sulfurifustis variabilis]|uniref:Uncharacterized protein n=1 Tax=Sulfurifustis variabilis TaxID=1675686 RepID=A0A1C7AFH3_9GAMM|nr:hypothetical protein SVA_3537 [Sulfurifustis variabilis]
MRRGRKKLEAWRKWTICSLLPLLLFAAQSSFADCERIEIVRYPTSYGWATSGSSCGGGTYDWRTASLQLSQAEICANRPNYAPGAVVAVDPYGSPVCAYPSQIRNGVVSGGCYDYLRLNCP